MNYERVPWGRSRETRSSSDSEESMSEFGNNGFHGAKGERSSPMCNWLKRKERRLRVKVRHLIKTNYFYWTVIFLVFLNTLFLCSVHHEQPEFWETFLFYAEFVFLGLFGIELVLKEKVRFLATPQLTSCKRLKQPKLSLLVLK